MFTAQKAEREILGEGNIRKIAEPFIEVLKQIGCDGFLSYEICSSQYVKHALISLKQSIPK
ncbi:hypothetical protein CW706_01555 [Candidatus Bathyarchaeota archaeon]|nr:MAG: hypothetical protein CW706_01555 [Candidatus Bathyarchaeota archaeon]